MEIVIVCQEMGWTYWEYMNQPSWFLDLVMKKLQIDNEKQIDAMEKADMRNKHRR